MNSEILASDLAETLNQLQNYDFLIDFNREADLEEYHEFTEKDLKSFFKDGHLVDELIETLNYADTRKHIDYLTSISLLPSDTHKKIKDEYLPNLKNMQKDFSRKEKPMNSLEEQTFKKLEAKVDKEYNEFIKELKGLPPEKIIERSYEISIKEDIKQIIENGNLNYQQVRALSKENKPLEELYLGYQNNTDNYLDELSNSIDITANDLAKNLIDKIKGER